MDVSALNSALPVKRLGMHKEMAIALCITDFVNVYIDICTVIITFAGFFVVVVLSFSISVDSFYLNP
mgnify:CR=1 FL=1